MERGEPQTLSKSPLGHKSLIIPKSALAALRLHELCFCQTKMRMTVVNIRCLLSTCLEMH